MKNLFLFKILCLILVIFQLGSVFLYFIKEMSLTSFILQTLTNVFLALSLYINRKKNKI